MIGEALTILETTTLPQGRAERARELLETAVKLADHLMEEKPAAVLGANVSAFWRERMPRPEEGLPGVPTAPVPPPDDLSGMLVELSEEEKKRKAGNER